VVRERGETPFRQIFWSRNGAPANIVGHRWNAEAFRQITSYSVRLTPISLFSGRNCPQTRDLASKISKKISGGNTPGPCQREGATPPAPTPSTATRRARGRKLPRCWDLGLGNRSPKSKFNTTRRLLRRRRWWADRYLPQVRRSAANRRTPRQRSLDGTEIKIDGRTPYH